MNRLSLPAALAVTLISSAVPALAQNWTSVPLGTSEDILVFQKTSFSEKWIAGANGFVAQSSLGITVWTPVSIGTTADLVSILEPSSGIVWIGGEGGAVRVKSGVNWLVRDVPSGGQNVSLFTRNSGAAIAVGDAGGIWRSTDTGATWTAQSSGTNVALRSGMGFVTGLSYIVGDAGTILKTQNGGTLWTPMTSGTTADLYDIADVANGWIEVVGDFGTILRSSDSGVTWSQVPSGTTARLRAMDSSGANANWHVAVGDGGVVLKSTNNGVSWCRLDAGTTATLYTVNAVNNLRYFAGGTGGLFLETTNGGGSCVSGTSVEVVPAASTELELEISPNPLSGVGSAQLRVARGQRVRADVLDAAGRRVARLLDQEVRTGEKRTLVLDARAWPSSVYFLRVEGAHDAAMRRLVVVK